MLRAHVDVLMIPPNTLADAPLPGVKLLAYTFTYRGCGRARTMAISKSAHPCTQVSRVKCRLLRSRTTDKYQTADDVAHPPSS